MRADSITQAKADIAAAVQSRSVPAPGATAQAAGPVVSVGLTGDGSGPESFKAAIFADSKEAAHAASEAVRGEATVIIMPKMATPRITREWSQKTNRPLEIGQQIRPNHANWVGTGGLFTKGGFQVSNEHVAGMGRAPGHIMRQGSTRYGTVHRVGGVNPAVRNHFDVSLTWIDAHLEARLRWDWGLRDNVRGIRSARPEDIGHPATNTGQTIGTQHGECFAIGVDNVPVGYTEFVAWFDGLTVYRKAGGGEFSTGGHSGSAIHMLSDSMCTDLLFAGGPDASGEDMTFACDMAGAIRHAGGVAELAQ